MTERRLLDNWKEIAAYLGRTERTCLKWEHELGLPIHRLDDSPKAHVFAYTDELDRWKGKKGLPERGRLSRRLSGSGRKTRFWLVAAAAVAVLVGVGYLAGPVRFAKRAPAPQAIKSVAVLPFVDLSPARDQEHLGDGIADILINALNGIEGLRTPARTWAFYFKGKDVSPEEIGRRLKVEWILEGSIQVQENKLRVVATLLSAADGYRLWTERYDRDLADIFAVEDEIARRVVDNLKVKIAGDRGAPLIKPGTQNLEAYNLYLTGQYYMRKGWFFYDHAIEFYGKSIERDPDYAEAYAGMAVCYFKLGQVGLARPAEVYPKAKTAALKALQIDGRNPYALGTLGYIKLTYDWDFPGTERYVRKAIQDDPQSPFLHRLYAGLLTALGRFEEGTAEVELALRPDPLSQDAELIGTPAFQYYFARKYDLAIEGLKEALKQDPQNAMNHIMLVQVYLATGRYEDARAINQKRREVLGSTSRPDDYEPWCAMVYARTGNPARAREIMANMKEFVKDKYYPYHMLAWVHAALGEKDEAFFWLEKAYQERSGQLYLLKVHPLADPLRDDPRFNDLLRRIGLEK